MNYNFQLKRKNLIEKFLLGSTRDPCKTLGLIF